MIAAADAYEQNTDTAKDKQLADGFDLAREEFRRCKGNLDFLGEIEEARKATGGFIVTGPSGNGDGQRIRVGPEPLTYDNPADGCRRSFFADLVAAAQNDGTAAARLARHREEMDAEGHVVEARDVTTGSPGATGFVPP